MSALTRRLRPIVTLLSLLVAGLAGADEIGGVAPPERTGEPSAMSAAGVGILAGVGAFAAGAVVGFAIGDDLDDDTGGIGVGIALGSMLGTIALPLGVHAGNDRRGNGWLVFGTSLVVGVAGWAATAASGEPMVLPLVGVAQVIACTAVEMNSMRSKEQDAAARPEPAPRFSLSPAAIDGKPGLVFAGTF